MNLYPDVYSLVKNNIFISSDKCNGLSSYDAVEAAKRAGDREFRCYIGRNQKIDLQTIRTMCYYITTLRNRRDGLFKLNLDLCALFLSFLVPKKRLVMETFFLLAHLFSKDPR